MNLAARSQIQLESIQRKIALFWGEREFSYAELWEQSQFVSVELSERFGVKSGDRVGLLLKNCPDLCRACLASSRGRGGGADQQLPEAQRGELHSWPTPALMFWSRMPSWVSHFPALATAARPEIVPKLKRSLAKKHPNTQTSNIQNPES